MTMTTLWHYRTRRNREVRDVFRKLIIKYNRATVVNFIAENYFLGPNRIYDVIQACDAEPVTDPSMIYKIVMEPGFTL
jgi:hypothetical protein